MLNGHATDMATRSRESRSLAFSDFKRYRSFSFQHCMSFSAGQEGSSQIQRLPNQTHLKPEVGDMGSHGQMR
jgi:hypothetical protein